MSKLRSKCCGGNNIRKIPKKFLSAKLWDENKLYFCFDCMKPCEVEPHGDNMPDVASNCNEEG